jgi:enterochelin esterase family protein
MPVTDQSVTNYANPFFSAILNEANRGTHEWWQRVAAAGTPLVTPLLAGMVLVTFVWRGERSHPPETFYIDVNGVTDHHSPTPQCLEPIPGTDISIWQTQLPSCWRGSYSFIPVEAHDLAPPPLPDAAEQRLAQRRWWSGIAERARADPLNPLPGYGSGWGGAASPLHLPDALDQSAWDAVDNDTAFGHSPGTSIEFEWHSALQGKRRTVWSHVTKASIVPAGGYPLVLLLDGRNWIERMPIRIVLDRETAAGRLLPAHYVFVDSIDGRNREEDLPPNPVFWTAICGELLPLIQSIAAISPDPRQRIVAGQSYGGLAALYAALSRPADFGGVIAQSASLWWPDANVLRSADGKSASRQPGLRGWLTDQAFGGLLPPSSLCIFMEVGSREDVMIDVNASLRDVLDGAGHSISYREYEGGHDALCWRGGLIDGLRWMLAPIRPDDLPERKMS